MLKTFRLCNMYFDIGRLTLVILQCTGVNTLLSPRIFPVGMGTESSWQLETARSQTDLKDNNNRKERASICGSTQPTLVFETGHQENSNCGRVTLACKVAIRSVQWRLSIDRSGIFPFLTRHSACVFCSDDKGCHYDSGFGSQPLH
jgi:hypothetical protein